MGRPKYGGQPLKVGGVPAGSAHCCCNVNCCCSIFTVDPTALDDAGYFLDSPTEIHWTISGDFTGSGVLTRTSVVAAGTSCIRYQIVDAEIAINGCPGVSILLSIDVQCGGELQNDIGFTVIWSAGGDGGATDEGIDPIQTGLCEPFLIVQTKVFRYVIASSCDGAMTRTITLTVTI